MRKAPLQIPPSEPGGAVLADPIPAVTHYREFRILFDGARFDVIEPDGRVLGMNMQSMERARRLVDLRMEA
jgi:hypothetical protein